MNSLGSHVVVPSNVQATVEDGWVTLVGHAEWEFQRKAAMNAVRHLFGVKGVSNDITLRPSIKPTLPNAITNPPPQNSVERPKRLTIHELVKPAMTRPAAKALR